MKKQGIALLLILIIGLSPVLNAFAECPPPNHFTNGPAATLMDAANDPAMAPMPDGRERTGAPRLIHCQPGSACTLHLCGSVGLIDAFHFTPAFLSHQPPPFRAAILKSRTLAPEPEPPIHAL